MAQALFPVAVYLLCSGLNFGIATSIFQLARRRSEVRVLHNALTALGCWYLTLAIAEISPNITGMLIAFLKAIVGTWLISSGVLLLAVTLRRFSGDTLQYRTVVIACHAVVIAVLAVNLTAADEPQFFEVCSTSTCITWKLSSTPSNSCASTGGRSSTLIM